MIDINRLVPESGWVLVELRAGKIVSFRRAALTAGLEKTVQIDLNNELTRVGMGPLGDMLWLASPEIRPHLKRLLLEEIDNAMEQDRGFWPISPYSICSEFVHNLFRPALDHLPYSRVTAQRACDIIRNMIQIDLVLENEYLDALRIRVFEWVLSDRYCEQVREIDPGLVDEVLAIEQAAAP